MLNSIKHSSLKSLSILIGSTIRPQKDLKMFTIVAIYLVWLKFAKPQYIVIGCKIMSFYCVGQANFFNIFYRKLCAFLVQPLAR